MTPKRFLSWAEFDLAASAIATNVSEAGAACDGVFGFPRGGLTLAVALSHLLGVPLVTNVGPSTLIVDDVFETGRTFAPYADHPAILKWVWASKNAAATVNVVTPFDPAEWLVFPWESAYAAEHDARRYYASR